jgi:hypothetical protein
MKKLLKKYFKWAGTFLHSNYFDDIIYAEDIIAGIFIAVISPIAFPIIGITYIISYPFIKFTNWLNK